MIKMGSTSEITELSKAQEPVQYFKRKYRNSSSQVKVGMPVLKLEDSLEDDLNKLFKAIDLKSSLDSPRMNPSKKPIKSGIPHSPKTAMSDPASLKQALRGFCVSQASEMAALKRSAKSRDSSAASDISRVQNTLRIDEERSRGILGISEKKPSSPRVGNFKIDVISPRYAGRKVQLANKSGLSSASSSPRLPTSITPRSVKSNMPSSFSPSKCSEPGKSPKKASYTGSNGNQLLCQRCQCSINPTDKTTDKCKISQSSKSSVGDFSSSTSVSADSSLGRSSCSNRPHMSKDAKWKAIRRVRSKHGVLSLENFNLLKKLGCGDIGTVYLAELIDSGCLFAIKVMDNEYLDRRKKLGRSQTEKEILKMLDHPFLPTLYSHFSCDNLSCLVMEYCPGGDLHVLRQKQPTRNFSESAARFYAAEVLLALEYLHMLGVVYRDLKPENILVREDGHIMLTDFDLSLRCTVSPVLMSSSSFLEHTKMMSARSTGSSCISPFCIEPSCFSAKSHKQKPNTSLLIHSLPQLVAEPTAVRSNSFVGTHEYLAPEIIKGEGHGSAVDWWTFGIFLYELLFGKTPFKGSGNDGTLANVVLQGLVFPDNPGISFEAMDLIRGLLVKDPDTRLGSERGAAEIKQHPFFEGLNWALIRCLVPPEVPDCYDFAGSVRVHRGLLEVGSAGEHLEFELF